MSRKNYVLGGKTKIICEGKKIRPILSSSDKVFYGGNTQFSYAGCRWIEKQMEITGKHIHHALCGHGGERSIMINKKEVLVDGLEPESKTVYQFNGCKFHGCPCRKNRTDYEINRYNETMDIENRLRQARI